MNLLRKTSLVRGARQLAARAWAPIGDRLRAPAKAPLRDELLTAEQLAAHARALAESHTLVTTRPSLRDPLRAALRQNERQLWAAQRSLGADVHRKAAVSPAAEWLLDNFYIVTQQIRQIRSDLPPGYYRELPKLVGGPLAGLPRVYAISLDLIGHTDGRIDAEVLLRFLSAYQAVTPLSMGELWAVAIMLRAGLVENLSRLSALALAARDQRVEADAWAERIVAEDHVPGLATQPVLYALREAHPQLPLTFAAHLLRRLRAYEGEQNIDAIVRWIEDHGLSPYSTIDSLTHAEHQRQARNQVSVGNTITSMRTISELDWPVWFESVSQVEQMLRRDPARVYGEGTFATRDHYRHVLERLAHRSRRSEDEVARLLVARAERAAAPRERHIGYYLVDAGHAGFAAELGYRPAPAERLGRLAERHPTAVYLGAVAGVSATVVGLGLRGLAGEARGRRALPLAAALLALPASALAGELVNRTLTQLLPPRRLPRLDLRAGLPAALRTIVVVPTLLLTAESVQRQLESLEVIALANDDPQLTFAVLSDFADAPEAHMPGDQELLDLAFAGVGRLNERHGASRFLLLHRRRAWNEAQGCWMGWERKRGKLDEFNRLLDGAADTTYETTQGDLGALAQTRYVITLDADTQLPRDAALALVGAMAHPLNQPVIDRATRRVVAGYGIMQPRVAIDLPSAMRSRFAHSFAGNVGVDPYTTAVSDVYMDLFGEGIYAGKGIYDPAALRESLDGRFPENTLLSHDLIEGSYARTALLSDLELLDSYPPTYAAAAARQHRWVRGDWQIAAWVLPWVPSAAGWVPNVLSPMARYRIFDNLRRSMVPPASVALLAASWIFWPRRAAPVAAIALGQLLLPPLFDLADAALIAARSPGNSAALLAGWRSLQMSALRSLMNIALLPDQALIGLDAAGRSLWRQLFTRRNLLEWETADEAQRRLQRSHVPLLRRTFPALLAGVALGAWRLRLRPALWPAAPVLADWLAAPALVAWLDRPHVAPRRALDDADLALLRRLARATWAYFEQFVDAEHGYLAPDNVQETPRLLAAERTSPTNIGLQLLADLAAYDLGYLGAADLADRGAAILDTVEGLERSRGHLLNWYDTCTLRPLSPAYISTVDSGNLAGALLALRQGYLALDAGADRAAQIICGLGDTLALLAQAAPANGPAGPELAAMGAMLAAPPDSRALPDLLSDLATRAEGLSLGGEAAAWAARLARQARSLLRDGAAAELGERLGRLAARCADLVEEMDFSFLYDQQRHLFAIGYSLSEGRRDGSSYDLLASEARLASYIAITKGDVPMEHWFHMGRSLAAVGTQRALVSWSGTMFEYLMPLLLMRSYPETLLDSTYVAVVERQIAYGRERGVPWGVSESAYNARDMQMNYQYRAFGVPGLGLKTGLGDDLVMSPYATMLALPVRPDAALANIRAMIDADLLGAYGLYEAVDYTQQRLPPGQDRAVVRSYMVHHQGMSLLAMANMLHGDSMQRRFHADPRIQAGESLLHERVPSGMSIPLAAEQADEPIMSVISAPPERQFTTPHTALPYTHLLSNGRYSVMLTNAGGGASWCDGLAVTRWRSDYVRDSWGSFIYLRDSRSGATWAGAYQPTRRDSSGYQVTYALDKVEFRQQVAGIDTRMEVVIAQEDNVELRRITLTNLGAAPRELELTSYAEVVLATSAADEAHPAFSNLFVETEYVAEREALLASRRPRAAGAPRPWAFHVAAVRGHTLGAVQYETDRAAFIGRDRNLQAPAALEAPLGGASGAVLDPIFSLRRRVRIAPGGSAQVIFATGMAASREEALALASKFHDPAAVLRVFELAWTQAQIELRHLGIDADQAHRFQRLASAAFFMDERRRARPERLARNTRGQPALWAYGISGDYPLMLVQVVAGDDLTLVQELLRAHEYWRLRGLMVDLVILNEDASGYTQGRQEQILGLIRNSWANVWLNKRGGVFLLRGDTLPEADRLLLEATARALLSTRQGDLSQHLRRRETDSAPPPARPLLAAEADLALPPVERILTTPYGGFSPDGREYIIDLAPGQATPAPWLNVVANEGFGFTVSAAGSGYTWAANSRENRLTPWSNDPVSDPPGEALYLRDEASRAVWSPTPQPAGDGHVRVRHGFGYSSFERQRGDIASRLDLFVPPDEPVKLLRLRLTNHGDRERRLTATLYVEWVLGVFRQHSAPYIITSVDEGSRALLARNPYNLEFAERVAFLACSEPEISLTGSRAEFIGRNGDLRSPAAMAAPHLSGHVGAGYDPCGAMRCALTLAPGEQRELVFLFGQAADEAEAVRLARRYREPAAAAAAWDAAAARWQEVLGAVQVRTPRPELDVLLNGWLLYQNLACRIWARSAFYQSGGAYGFRDQLQDVMALAHAAPDVARAQIRRAAAHQFVAGDVQHWWHPPSGRGVRTRFSDDYLWLPFVAMQYIQHTGDDGLLDAVEPFLEGRPLEPEEAEYYDQPSVSAQTAPLYQHCARAIDYGLGRMGAHGLPLIGAGDWNDGMNMVGDAGQGESVWVGWFLIAVLRPFADLAERRGDAGRAARYRAEAERLRAALEQHTWDGAWYLRAFYDDGTPLGSAQGDECRIDSLTQSWALISGAGDPARARQAMQSLEDLLVDQQAGLIRLFAPPFDTGAHNPGYIKGYVPGVRENGGQYTHAAIWAIWAWTLLGDGDRAGALLDLINPVRHASANPERYRAEPYTIAADVYTAEGHLGRGGWTWYTGSAGWLYRLGVEQILGLRRAGDRLTIAPCLPAGWPGFTARYRYGGASYLITVERASGDNPGPALILDGQTLEDGTVPLRDDGASHIVIVRLAAAAVLA